MIAPVMLCTSAIILLLGMFGGMAMGMHHDYTLSSAHAHMNLVGGVLLFMFGLYYRAVPAAGQTRLAAIQGWIHIAAAIIFPIGIGMIKLHGPAYELFPVIGGVLVLVAVGLFLAVVFRTERRSASHA